MNNESIILVHGLWMSGIEMFHIKLYFSFLGYDTYSFQYNSLHKSPEYNAEALKDTIKTISQRTHKPVHLISHSLGGLISLKAFERNIMPPEGRNVLIGSPVNGSSKAEFYGRTPVKWVMGKSFENCLKKGVEKTTGGRDTGLVIGAMPERENDQIILTDGTVNFDEVYFNATDVCVFPYSHLGLLFSPSVIKNIRQFIETGYFE